MGYAIVKALHIIAVISWMAGMLYLPRLYAYHAQTEPGSETSELFKTMERRLLAVIITPAMLASWSFGAILAVEGGYVAAGWFHAKFLLVLALTGFYVLLVRWKKDFATDRNRHGQRFYRACNEIPTALMIGIVLLAVLKPW
ncbi:MAG TPA: protoporphyrinogen oxidase HemJ [Dongiaceae bacterium]|jgi:putative membrane protein|nr:protoporphyrinogen oxidase HemJ [Dongiaceae bacterium]